jgi:transposase
LLGDGAVSTLSLLVCLTCLTDSDGYASKSICASRVRVAVTAAIDPHRFAAFAGSVVRHAGGTPGRSCGLMALNAVCVPLSVAFFGGTAGLPLALRETARAIARPDGMRSSTLRSLAPPETSRNSRWDSRPSLIGRLGLRLEYSRARKEWHRAVAAEHRRKSGVWDRLMDTVTAVHEVRRNRIGPIPCSRLIYRTCNLIERFQTRIEEFCRIANRCDGFAETCLAMIKVASTRRWPRALVSPQPSA